MKNQSACQAKRQTFTRHHAVNCQLYRRLLHHLTGNTVPAQSLAELPYLSVRLFKQFALQSVAHAVVFKTLYSSGTTGQPSRIVLDKDAVALQSKVLMRIMQHWLGKDRLPMLIINHLGVVKDRSSFSARGAGIQGLAFMGRVWVTSVGLSSCEAQYSALPAARC